MRLISCTSSTTCGWLISGRSRRRSILSVCSPTFITIVGGITGMKSRRISWRNLQSILLGAMLDCQLRRATLQVSQPRWGISGFWIFSKNNGFVSTNTPCGRRLHAVNWLFVSIFSMRGAK